MTERKTMASPCRYLSEQQVAAVAASMGLPVAPLNICRSRLEEERLAAQFAAARNAAKTKREALQHLNPDGTPGPLVPRHTWKRKEWRR